MSNEQFAKVKEQIAYLMGAMKSIEDFKIKSYIDEGLKVVADFVKVGDTNSAIRAGNDLIRSARGSIIAFLRNSVFDQEAAGTMEAKKARFTYEIRNRMNHHDGPYDGDIIARLQKVRDTFAEVMNTERSNDFTERIKACNAMKAALREADVKQKQLDRTKFEVVRQKIRTADILEKRSSNGGRVKTLDPRTEKTLTQELEKERREAEAEEILALLSAK